MADGVITDAARLKVQLRIQEFMQSNSPQIAHLNNDNGTIKALRERQAPSRIDILENSTKDDQIDVHWIEKTESAPVTGTTDCAFTGPEAGSFVKTYTLSDYVEKNFSISEDKFRTSQFDPIDLLAIQFAEADAALTENINTKAIAFLNGNIGTNAYSIPGNTLNDATGTTLPASQYTSALMAHIMLSTKRNKMSQPFLIGGARAYLSDWLTNTDTSDGADGRKSRLGMMDMAFDVDGLIGDAADPTYIVDRLAYATAVKNRNEAGIKDLGYEGRKNYTFQSQSVPGITWDVFERKSCEKKGQTTTHFSMTARVGFFLNPVYSQLATAKGVYKLLTA